MSSCDFQDLLLNDSFDLIYVDWQDPEEYIQANANTLIEVLKKINHIKSLSHSKERNVIMGHSMGGLIIRYALKTMEIRGEPHQVSTYVSYDTPHLGAHIPLGVLYGFYALQQFIDSRGLMKELILNSNNISQAIKLGRSLAYSNAAQQMLVYYVDPAGHFNNQEHYKWQVELNALGFPKGDSGFPIQNLAVANGSYSQPQIPPYFLSTDFSAKSDLLSSAISRLNIKWQLVIALGIGIGLNDIVSGLMTLLPGRTSIQGHFDLFPAFKVGDRVTDVELKYKKTFKWLIPLQRKLFSYEKDYPEVLCYDIYPGSYYGVSRDDKGKIIEESSGGGGIPLVFDYEFDTSVASSIQFIPTSSALAYGDGITSGPTFFFHRPVGNASPFGENYFVESKSGSHAQLTKTGLGWVTGRLRTTIQGPIVGFTGAKYKLTGYSGKVHWDSTNSDVAIISSDGELTARGKGFTTLLALTNAGVKYSLRIAVGMPRFVLDTEHVPGGYRVKARCIDTEYKGEVNALNSFRFRWGVKYPNAAIRWFSSDSKEIMVEPRVNDQAITFFCQAQDPNGRAGDLLQTTINPITIYYSRSSTFIIDSNGEVYKENMTPYYYDIAQLYIDYKPTVSGKYKGREWMVTSATVSSPSGKIRTVPIRNKSVLVRDIIPESEVNWIRDNSEDSDVQVYLLSLKNSSGDVIQRLPVSFVFKSL